MAFNFPDTPTVGQLYPASPAAGAAQYVWNGTTWVATGSPDANYVRKSGDNMSGALVLNADPVVALGAATKQYADSKVVDISGKVNKAGDTMLGPLYTATTSGSMIAVPAVASNAMMVVGAPNSDTYISFNRVGQFACNFGLGSDNKLYYGGWSFGANAYRIWGAQDCAAAPICNVRLLMAADYSHPANAAILEPYPGAVVCGLAYVPNYWITMRYRWLQVQTTGWYTIGVA